MNAVLALAQKDLRVIYRDRFLLLIAGYAFILAAVARFGAPWLPVENIDLYLAPAIVLFGTMLLGTLLGFALVEEREQGTWLLLRVLPVGAGTVLTYLVIVTGSLSFGLSLLAALLYGHPIADWPAFLFMLTASSLLAPLFTLLIGALAKNKIEGLAVSKILSAAGVFPLALFFVPSPWQVLAAWCPFYWLYLGLLQAYAGDSAELALNNLYWPGHSVWLAGSMSILLSSVGLAMLMRFYLRQAS